MDYVDCIYYLTSPDQARFQNELRECSGRPDLGKEMLEQLRQLELNDEHYGALLFDALFPRGSQLLQCYRQTEVQLEEREQGMRFRLHLDSDLPGTVRGLPWERIFDAERRIALARSPRTPFSRYPAGGRLPGAATREPRLLAAIAAPPDLERYQLPPIDEGRFRRRLESCLQTSLQGRVEGEFLAGAVTPQALRDRLDQGFHALHLVAHGIPPAWRDPGLLLENDRGLAELVDESVVSDIFLTSRNLRLVVLMACHSGADGGNGPIQGLAGRLSHRGLPGVIAMRRQISVAAADLFTETFYASLAESEQVDVAANRARLALYLDGKTRDHWSDPVLAMRLRAGRPWGRVTTPPWFRWWPLIAAFLLLLLLSLLVASRGTDVEPVPAAEPALQRSQPESLSSPTRPAPAAREDSPTAAPAKPAPEPVRKTAARREATAPPQPDLQAIAARMQDAESFGGLGGSGNDAARLRIYEQIVAGLPRDDLNPTLLRQAEEQVRQGHTAGAADLYHQLLDAYLQASSPSIRRNDP